MIRRCPICKCEPRERLAVSEVAHALRVESRTVRRWIASGLLAATQFNQPRGAYHVHHDSLDALVAASRTIEVARPPSAN